MLIRDAKIEDLNKIVKVHMRAFPGFFMTKLGKKFLWEYYFTVLSYPYHIFLVALNDESIIGFVAGFLNPSKFYSFLKKRKLKVGLAITLEILRNPFLIFRVIQNYKRVNSNILENKDKVVELASIAVDPDFEGRGIGKRLVNEFLKVSSFIGGEIVILTTDAENNDKVNHFYKSLGFELKRSYLTTSKRLMNEYHFSLKKFGKNENMEE